MAATAEAPAAEVAAPTTTTKQQQAPSSSSSKQAEEPVPVVSSLASVYPDGDFFFLKKETAFRFLPFGTGLARRLLFCFLWREHHPDVSYSMQRQKGAIKSAATPPPSCAGKKSSSVVVARQHRKNKKVTHTLDSLSLSSKLRPHSRHGRSGAALCKDQGRVRGRVQGRARGLCEGAR